MATIADSAEWKALQSHAEDIKKLHLRDLMSDAERCRALSAEAGGIVFDYSRQNATAETKG